MNNNDKQDPNMKSNQQTIIMLVVAAILTFIVISSMSNYLNSKERQELSCNEFARMVEVGEVDSIEVGSTEIMVISKKGNIKYSRSLGYYVVRLEGDCDFINRILDNDVITSCERSDSSTLLLVLLNYAVPLLFLLLLMNSTMKRMSGGGIMGVGKPSAKMYVQKETDITLKDVAGEDEAKESLIGIVNFLHNPSKYTKTGAKLPKGALLVGPPGTDKTLSAKAMAGEAHVPFCSLFGSDFVKMSVSVGASRVRDLSKSATENTPCIVLIDEIDVIGHSRDSCMGGSDEHEQTLNQLLSEMNRSDFTKGLLVLGATNRPEVLDPTLFRPRRFDRRVMMDKPDLNGRISILKIHSRDVLLDESVDFKEAVLAISDVVGADLASIVNEAVTNTARHGRNAVSQKDLFEAVEVVPVGKEKKDRIMSREERRIISYYEVGHALVSALQEYSGPAQKITIVPRAMGIPGYVMNVPGEERYLNTKKELEARLVELMAGRAAEEIALETVTTGAVSGIQQATNLARAVATQYGMSDRSDLMGLESQENQYLTSQAVLNYGDAATVEIGQEVMEILEGSYDEAIRFLGDSKDVTDQITAPPIDEETIIGEEFTKVFHRVRGIPEPEGPREDDDKGTTSQELHASPETQTDRGEQESQAEQVSPQGQISPEEQANPQEQVNPEEQANPQTQPSPRNQSGPEVSDRGSEPEKKTEDTVWSHPGNDRNPQH